MVRASIRAVLVLFGLSCSAGLAWAQGLLVDTNVHTSIRLPRPIAAPRPPAASTYRIKEIDVQARIVDQVASVRVSQTFASLVLTSL